MKKRAVIATLLTIADTLDETARHKDATILTKVAQRIAQYDFPESRDPNIHLKEQDINQGDDFDNLLDGLSPEDHELLLGGVEAEQGHPGDMGARVPPMGRPKPPRRPHAPMMEIEEEEIDPNDPFANE